MVMMQKQMGLSVAIVSYSPTFRVRRVGREPGFGAYLEFVGAVSTVSCKGREALEVIHGRPSFSWLSKLWSLFGSLL